MDFFKFFRSDSFDLDFFGSSKWILEFFGFWPLDFLKGSTKVKIFINLFLIVVQTIGEGRFAWFVRSEPLEALFAICTCLTRIATFLKLVCFLVNRKELAELMRDLSAHLTEDYRNDEKKSMIQKSSIQARGSCYIVYFFSMSTTIEFIIKPFVVWGIERLNGIENSWVSMPFQAALPYKNMTQLNDKTLYTLMYAVMIYAGIVTASAIPGIDGFFASFCVYTSVSYQCLQKDFEKAFRTHTRAKDCSNNQLYHDLIVLVKRQESVTTMFKRFDQIYKFIVLVHCFFSSIILAVVLFTFTLTPGIAKMFYLSYVVGFSFQLFLYCFSAEIVNRDLLKFSQTLYFCDWYKCDRKVKSLVLIVLLRSQRGVTISSPFFSPSLPLFASIIRTSGSYFTILQTVM